MFIQTEATPNPQTMKFLPGVPVMPQGTAFYTDAKLAEESPLAASLFKIDEVSAVFLGSDESRMITGTTIAADGGRSSYLKVYAGD